MKLGFGKEHNAPWEQAFDSVLSPLEEFIHRQTTSGVLLMLCAVIALVIANSPWSEAYHHLLQAKLTIGFTDFQISKTLHHWINDGIMAIFFFVVGELSDPKQAILPIVAAFGGMVVPILIYMMINPEGSAFRGWGVPMATDIAFALGVLALLGKRVPTSLLTFLVALAIVDDVGAVTVIAVYYTETINFNALAVVGLMLFFLIALNLGGIRRPLPFILLGIILWIAMLISGVHATLAGIFLAFTIPLKPKYDPKRFLDHINEMVDHIKTAIKREPNIIKNSEFRARVQALGDGVQLVQAPAQVLEHKMHLPSAYIVIPIFSLANAGIPVNWAEFGATVTHPVTLGIVGGLYIGKLIGIAGLSWLVVKLGITTLPKDINFKHLIGVGLLGGIGFTMSIFVAELGFAQSPNELLMAKTGVLLASILTGLSGFLWLYFTAEKK